MDSGKKRELGQKRIDEADMVMLRTMSRGLQDTREGLWA